MRRSLFITLALGVALLLGLAGWVLFSFKPEPTYKGRPLSTWLDQAGSIAVNPANGRPIDWSSGANSGETMRAISAIGTNGLPWLVKWLGCRPYPWTPWTRPIARKLPAHLRNSVLVQDLLADKRYLRLHAAAWSFSVLRRDATPAVPALTRLMNDPRRPEVSERAMVALSCIGEAGFGSLLAGVTNRAFPNRAMAASSIWSMTSFGSNALAAVPVFARCLKDGDQEVARHAALLLGDITPRGEGARLALIEALHDPRVPIRAAAITSLAKFSGDRLDGLLEASKDTDPTVRAIACRALKGRPIGLLQLP